MSAKACRCYRPMQLVARMTRSMQTSPDSDGKKAGAMHLRYRLTKCRCRKCNYAYPSYHHHMLTVLATCQLPIWIVKLRVRFCKPQFLLHKSVPSIYWHTTQSVFIWNFIHQQVVAINNKSTKTVTMNKPKWTQPKLKDTTKQWHLHSQTDLKQHF